MEKRDVKSTWRRGARRSRTEAPRRTYHALVGVVVVGGTEEGPTSDGACHSLRGRLLLSEMADEGWRRF